VDRRRFILLQVALPACSLETPLFLLILRDPDRDFPLA
jgi:hypothetical protein